jgi:hypothetical protein
MTLIPDDCYMFNGAIKLDTENDEPVLIEPEAYLVQGAVELVLGREIMSQ